MTTLIISRRATAARKRATLAATLSATRARTTLSVSLAGDHARVSLPVTLAGHRARTTLSATLASHRVAKTLVVALSGHRARASLSVSATGLHGRASLPVTLASHRATDALSITLDSVSVRHSVTLPVTATVVRPYVALPVALDATRAIKTLAVSIEGTARSRVILPVFAIVATRPRTFLPVSAQTGSIRERTGLTISLKTGDLDIPPLPLPPPTPAGDQVFSTPVAYLITHSGLPALAKSYTLGTTAATGSDTKARSTATIEVLGDLGVVKEDIYATVAAQGLTDGSFYAQRYGPFSVLRSKVSQRAGQTTTTLSTADVTAAQVAASLGVNQVITEEFLPWEREKDLTPKEAAQKARNDAWYIRARPQGCSEDPDYRHQSVTSLLWWVINKLGAPVSILGTLPFAGDYFWASEETPYTNPEGPMLIGTTYKVKGKKPLDILRDILGRVGWSVTTVNGTVVMGPPTAQSSGLAETAALLGVPTTALEAVDTEYVNAGATGDLSTPSQIIMQGASYRRWLPPISMTGDEQFTTDDPATFEVARDMTLITETTKKRMPVDNDGNPVWGTDLEIESITKASKTKRGGLLREESSETNGLVPRKNYPDDPDDTTTYDVWIMGREVTKSAYEYLDNLYPEDMTHKTSSTVAWVELVREYIETARATETWERHIDGWLMEHVTTTTKVDSWETVTDYDGEERHKPKWTTETITETWVPLGGGIWQHKQTTDSRGMVPRTEDGVLVELLPHAISAEDFNDLTDQGPPEGRKVPPKPPRTPGKRDDVSRQFPHDEPITSTLNTNGLGDAQTVDVPWAATLDHPYAQNILAQQRQRPSKRTTYNVLVPVEVEAGGIIKSFSVSGSAGSFRCQIVVEEAI